MKIDNKPRLYLLAQTKIYEPGMSAWLDREFGCADLLEKRKQESVTDGAILIEMAGRRCYRSFAPGLNPNVQRVRETNRSHLANTIDHEHGSVFAHANITVAFENVSRVFTHEIVRNAIGNAFSQESMRYVRFDSFQMRIPELIENVADPLIKIMQKLEKELGKIGKMADKMESFTQKKAFTSAIRRFLPTVQTGIIVTFNWRSLRWALAQRSHEGAEEEMREVMGELYTLVLLHAPEVLLDAQMTTDEASLSGERKWIQFKHPKI